jgi:hypothetical protein
MTDSNGAPLNPVARIAGMVELMTSLDTKILAALESLDQIRTTMSGFQELGAEGDVLIADIRSKIQKLDARMEALDGRINRDLDDLKAALLAKIEGLDTEGIGDRFDRLERSIMNIERATMNLDQAFEGTMDLLPNFMTKKIKEEGKDAQRRDDAHQPQENAPIN